ncbi:MAG: TrkH family potassium uptake protein [Syntrophomonadaceae bacterium]
MIRPAVIISHLGLLILIIGIAMLSCLPWSIVYKEDVIISISLAATVTIISGLLLKYLFSTGESINIKESFALVSLGWILASVFGSLPFIFSGYLPNFADAFFETVSGFTTTGASVVKDVEVWPRGLMFWRCLTQWLGGMGIIALFIAIIAGMGARGNQLFKAEVPGGSITDKISPRIRETAQKLWLTYIIISIACLLLLLVFGMNLFDALCHTFATMATGGFSTKNASVGFYSSPYIQWTITIFMFIAATNFSLHYLAYKGRRAAVYFKNPEFRFYTGIALTATAIAALGLHLAGGLGGWEEKIRLASFQVVSIMSTTGYATANYDLWPTMSTGVLFLMMFVGGCIGSTGGNIKPGRYLIIMQKAVMEFKKMVHPKAVLTMRYGGRVLNEDVVSNVVQFFCLYIMLVALGVLVLTMLGIDIVSSLTATASCLGNIGPGFAAVGPTQNYSFIPDAGKYLLSAFMLIGRLEIFPMLVLLLPAYWKQ